MKQVREIYYGNRPKWPRSVSEAIADETEDNGLFQRPAGIEQKADNTARMLGALVQHLSERGVLADDFILGTLLRDRYEKLPDDFDPFTSPDYPR